MAVLAQLPGETYEEWSRRNALMGNPYQINTGVSAPPAAQAPATGSFQNWFGDVPPEVMAPLPQAPPTAILDPGSPPAQQQQTGGPTVPQQSNLPNQIYDVSPDETGGLATFRQMYNLPEYGYTPYQSYQARQFDPLWNLFRTQNYLGQAGANSNFADFARNVGINPANQTTMASGLLNQLRAKPGYEQQAALGLGTSGGQPELGTGTFESLLASSLRPRYGMFANKMAGTAGGAYPTYLSADVAAGQAGGSAGSFLDYLLSRYGI